MSIALLLMALWVTVWGQVPDAGTTVSGRVTDAVNGGPVRGALVRLTYSPRRGYAPGREHIPPQRSAISDRNGVFTITSVEAGVYSAWASKIGYLDGRYGAKRPRSLIAERLQVPGEATGDVELRVWPEASIVGRITDERGRPVIAATVRVIPKEPDVFGEAKTDDRGMYRIAGLPPGEYAVVVPSSINSYALDPSPSRDLGIEHREPFLLDRDRRNILLIDGPVPPTSKGRPSLYVTSVFGGSTVADATYLSLSAGEERSRIDITLRSRPAVRVSGTIVGPSGAIPGVIVILRPEGQREDLLVHRLRAVADREGAFSFVLAPAGRYVLKAIVRVPPMTPVRINDAGQPVFAMDDVTMNDEEDFRLETPLTITDTDITNLALTMRPGTLVHGTVAAGDAAGPTLTDGKANVLFVPLENARYGVRGANVAIDGTFSFKAKPGRYLLLGPSTTSGWHFKDAILNGTSIGDGPLTVDNDPITDLKVILTRQETRLDGVVIDAAGKPLSDSTVVLFRADRRRWDGLSESHGTARVLAADDGRFEIGGIFPDEYLVAVVDDSLMAQWPMRSALERLAPLATRVRLTEGEPVHLTLTVQGREP